MVSDILKTYLERQKSRLQFYSAVQALLIAAIAGLAALYFGFLSYHFLDYLRGGSQWKGVLLYTSYAAALLIVLVSFWLARGMYKKQKLSDVASEVESSSSYFDLEPQARSELVSAAAILESDGRGESDFERAHLDLWSRRLGAYKVELRPKWKSLVLLGAVFILGGGLFDQVRYFEHPLPDSLRPWHLTSFEERMPYEGSSWEDRFGGLSGVRGSRVRFVSPRFGWLETYLFLREEGAPHWTRLRCGERCELEVNSNARYAVGTLLFRSAQFPLQAIPDESPRVVLFLRQGEDLLPGATLQIQNSSTLSLELLATDDIRLRGVQLVRSFEGVEEVLLEREMAQEHFRENYTLRVSDWQGGRHDIVLRARDDAQWAESHPIIINFADEEFLRQERIRNLRGVIDEWLHVLADLLESNQTGWVIEGLASRVDALEYPLIDEEGLITIYFRELQKLSERIRDRVVLQNRVSELPSFIEQTEKQILYGLSLLFQERAGDVQASNHELQESQKSLQDLVESLRSGKEQLSSDKIQEAFEKLLSQLEDLQERMKNLPQGPSDSLVNREALEEQVSQGQELEERIAAIQDLISRGADEQALRELESLVNQLGILSKEIDRSLSEWQENLNQGAMQASEDFERRLGEIQKAQQELLERTEALKQKQAEMDAEQMRQFQRANPEEQEAVNKELEELSGQQQSLQDNFQELVESFGESLQGSEWEQVFRSQEVRDREEKILESMGQATQSLEQKRSFDAAAEQAEAVELLRQAAEAQKEMRQSVEQMSEQMLGGSESRRQEKVEVIESQGRGELERRRKIMNSLSQEVDEDFQPSHRRYFEELLQR